VADRSVRYAQHGRVAVLQVDDGKANALSPALIGELPHPAFRDTKRRERQATVERIRRTLDDDIASLTTPVPA
jgi:hypothetical protein